MNLSAFSLRNKLLVFATALIVVPGLVLVFIAQRSGRTSLQEVIGRQLARESHHGAEQLAAVLRSERETLLSFARLDLMREIRVGDIDKRVAVALATLRDGSAVRRDYLVIGPKGRAVAASDPALLAATPAWALEPLPAEPEARGHPVRVRGPIDAPGGALLLMTTEVPDPDDPGGAPLGRLVACLRWEVLIAVTSAARADLLVQNVDAEVLVVARDGRILGGAPTDRGRSALPLWSGSPAAASETAAASQYRVDSGEGVILGWAALGPDLPDWHLVVVEPLSHALAPANRLTRQLGVTMGLALLAALVVAALAARRVVEPLTELTAAIRRLPRSGAVAPRVPVKRGDEVGVLGETFNRMAAELHEAQRELVEAEKFAFVGELASGVAHEIRTSLGVLNSSAQILGRSLPEHSSGESAELANMIGEEVKRLSGVVDDLLTLDRQRELQLEAILVSEPVGRAVNFVEPKARMKGIALECRPLANEAPVLCDPEVIQQACVNLLVNAISALEAGGTIEVRILPPGSEFGGFTVSDDGRGVPASLREEIFKPFVTASEGGVGLGLTFVKRVVHEHRGRVSLEETPVGSSFRIELRLAGEQE